MQAMNSIRLAIDLAIDLATRQRDEAGKALAQIERNHQGAQDQMGQLESYASETESKWSVAARERSTPEIIHHSYQFMARLHQAADMQRHVMADLRRQAETAKQRVLEAEVRISGLQKVLAKKQAVLDRQQVAREQKQNDEFAAQQYRRRLADVETPGVS